ncbi:hypothetical protein LguiA_008168 [Lonicera macranthoides]
MFSSSPNKHLLKLGHGCDQHRDSIMDGYVKYGLVQDAGQLFDEMSERMIVDWNLMISGYWNWGNEVKARQLFQMIPERNVITSNAMVKDLETARRAPMAIVKAREAASTTSTYCCDVLFF